MIEQAESWYTDNSLVLPRYLPDQRESQTPADRRPDDWAIGEHIHTIVLGRLAHREDFVIMRLWVSTTENVKRLQKLLFMIGAVLFVCIMMNPPAEARTAALPSLMAKGSPALAAANPRLYDIQLDEPSIVSDHGRIYARYTLSQAALDEQVQQGHESDVTLKVSLQNPGTATTVSLRLEAATVKYISQLAPSDKGARLILESPWLRYSVLLTDLQVDELADMLEATVDALALRIEFARALQEEHEWAADTVRKIGGELVYTPVKFDVWADVLRPSKEGESELESFVVRRLPGELLLPEDQAAELDWDQTAVIRVLVQDIGVDKLSLSRLLPVFVDAAEYRMPTAIGDSLYMMIRYSRTFEDIADLPERPAIEYMASKLIFTGRGERTFAPDHYLTQAEMAALVVRMLGMEGRDYPVEKMRRLAAVAFDDVQEDVWYAVYAGSLYYAGRLPVGQFGASKQATLEQLNELLFSPDQEVIWNVEEGEGTLLTRAKAAEMMYQYYTDDQ